MDVEKEAVRPGEALPPDRSSVGLYGPGSLSWRINRERILLLTGPRALLMQLAHPRVARGVHEHSDFRQRPFRRLAHTLTLSLNGVFGDTPTALAAVRRINTIHTAVRGDGYSATDPDLLAWVAATLVDSAVLGYELFVGPLQPAEKDGFYTEARYGAGLLGTPPDALPADFAGLRRYVAEMIESGEARVDEIGLAAGRDTLYPPRLWYVPRSIFDLAALFTAGQLPEPLRAQYRLPWSPRHRAAFERIVRVTRVLVPRLPAWLRWVPQARAAYRRVRAA